MRHPINLALTTLLASSLFACSADDGANSNDSGPTPGNDGAVMNDGGPGPDAPFVGDGGAPLDTPTIGDFVGVNGFIDEPTDKLATIGNVREYHDWQWCEGNGDKSYPGYPNNQNSFSLFNGYWDWDKYYGDLKAKGVIVSPVIQGGAPWLNNGAVPPTMANASQTAPASYAAHADEMFQFAARYGTTKVADGLLKLAQGQTRLSGVGSLRYIEDFNEQDATWVLANNQQLFTADVYAAMASADYDGDQGRMGKTVGVKNADPNMKMVLGGLAGAGPAKTWLENITQYLDGIKAWSAAHRGGSFPADVINVHYYSFGASQFGDPNPKPALSPEADGVKATMTGVRAWRDTNAPGKELWLTEFGYDTDAQSRLRAPAIGSNSAEIVQAQWLVRYYLAVMAAGFDRAFVFAMSDGCSGGNCHVQFDTCGLTTVKVAAEKPSYYFIATMRARLGGLQWLGEQPSNDPSVTVYKFKDPKSGKGAFVVWSPTSTAHVVNGYALNVGSAQSTTKVDLVDQQVTGKDAPLTVNAGKVSFDVTETPTFVLVDTIQ